MRAPKPSRVTRPKRSSAGTFRRFIRAEAIERGLPAHELDVAAREGRFEDEGWRIRKDGTRFWANVVITALHGSDGSLDRLCEGDARPHRAPPARRKPALQRGALSDPGRRCARLCHLHAGSRRQRRLVECRGSKDSWASMPARSSARHFSRFLVPDGTERVRAELRAASRGARGPLPGGRLAHAQEWLALLGQRGHHRHSRPGRGTCSAFRRSRAT